MFSHLHGCQHCPRSSKQLQCLAHLRMVQSAGGSGTVAPSSAVVADIITSQERGTFVSYISIAPQARPSIGPIIGGLLGQYLSWHLIFRFLTICTGVVCIPVVFSSPRHAERSLMMSPSKMELVLHQHQDGEKIPSRRSTSSLRKTRRNGKKQKTQIPQPMGINQACIHQRSGLHPPLHRYSLLRLFRNNNSHPVSIHSVYGFNQLQFLSATSLSASEVY